MRAKYFQTIRVRRTGGIAGRRTKKPSSIYYGPALRRRSCRLARLRSPALERLDVAEPGGAERGDGVGGGFVVRVVEDDDAPRADRVVEVVDLVARDIDAREIVDGAAAVGERTERGAAAVAAGHAGAAGVGHHPLAVRHVVGEVVGVLRLADVDERDRRFIVGRALRIARHHAQTAHVDAGLPRERRLELLRVGFGVDPHD